MMRERKPSKPGGMRDPCPHPAGLNFNDFTFSSIIGITHGSEQESVLVSIDISDA